jgi:tetratricopeptide (TPR) repeat protein
MLKSEKSRIINTMMLSLAVIVLVLAGCASPSRRGPITGETKDPVKVTPERPADIVIVDANQTAAEGNLKKAAFMLDDLIKSHPENIKALRLLAKIYSSLGEEDKSLSIWERVFSLDPSDPDAVYETGQALASRQNWSQLRLHIQELENIGKADKRHFLLIGQADIQLGYKTEAEKYLQKAKGLQQTDILLGKLYYGQGRYSESETAFKRALRKNPDNYSVHLHLGYINYSRKRYSAAVEHYQKATSISSNKAHTYLCLAAVYQKMGDSASAIKYFENGLSLTGTPGIERKKAYNTLCRLLVKTGNIQEVYSIIRRGLKEFPDSGGLYFYWGIILLKDGSPTDAKSKFKKAAQDPVWRKAALQRFHSIP